MKDTIRREQLINIINKCVRPTCEEGTVIDFMEFLTKLNIKPQEIPRNKEILNWYNENT